MLFFGLRCRISDIKRVYRIINNKKLNKQPEFWKMKESDSEYRLLKKRLQVINGKINVED